jgi:hypothetical protein
MDTVPWFDRIEKVGRVVLWLAIASAFVIVPVSYISQKRAEAKAEAELHEEVKKAEARADDLEKEKDKRPNRLTLASMGAYVYGINYSLAQGNLTFTNVSPRTGVLCVIGEAQEPDLSMKTSQSIPACAEVGEYKTVHLSRAETSRRRARSRTARSPSKRRPSRRSDDLLGEDMVCGKRAKRERKPGTHGEERLNGLAKRGNDDGTKVQGG